jgi:hypothetical protein
MAMSRLVPLLEFNQHRERQAAIPKIEQTRSIEEELVQSLTLSRTPEKNEL